MSRRHPLPRFRQASARDRHRSQLCKTRHDHEKLVANCGRVIDSTEKERARVGVRGVRSGDGRLFNPCDAATKGFANLAGFPPRHDTKPHSVLP